MRAVEIHETPAGDPPAQFFVTVGYGSLGAPDDEVVLATIEGHIVGAVRLAREPAAEDSILVLRGVQVEERWRGRGLGRRLLDMVARHLADETSWVIAYQHLERFYANAGWVRATDPPPLLAARAARFREHGDDVFVAARRVATSAA